MSADERDLIQLGFNPQQALHIADRGGWTPVNQLWSYASATTITVPTDATLRYGKGMKLKFTQHGTVKYFYIVGVAATVLTVTAGTDYTVEDTATYPITNAWYSYFNNALGFPHWFNWTPSYPTTGQGLTYADVIPEHARFCINGLLLYLELRSHGTVGGSAGTHIKALLPVVPAYNDQEMTGRCDNAGLILSVGVAGVDGYLYVYRSDFANITTGSNRYVIHDGAYGI
jgi:hypothetical protein